MLRRAHPLLHYHLHAVDGDIGAVKDLYFDDAGFGVRYVVVDTGHWLSGRRVLILPSYVENIDDDHHRIGVNLTRAKVENSPLVEEHKPLSRVYEEEYHRYYDWPPYWGDGVFFPPPGMPLTPIPHAPRDEAAYPHEEVPNRHLRSIHEVTGYHNAASDGDIGHVADFIVDDAAWTIRYLEIDTRNWWPGKMVLMAPTWIKSVDWVERKVEIALSREAIRTAPTFFPEAEITREYEARLYKHYGQRPYWEE